MKHKYLFSPIKYSYEDERSWWQKCRGYVIAFLLTTLILGTILFSCRRGDEVFASEIGYSNEQIANAIYRAEGGDKTSHPYGILAHYKNTTPRQACINTIKHAQKDWNGKGDFLLFLQKRYAPIGVFNDPSNLNVNWLKNVKYFLGVSNV